MVGTFDINTLRILQKYILGIFHNFTRSGIFHNLSINKKKLRVICLHAL